MTPVVQVCTLRIYPNIEFWSNCVDKATHFFNTCVLPEMLGKWYTRPSNSCVSIAEAAVSRTQNTPPKSSNVDDYLKLYCYCRQPEDGIKDMIACDNPECSIEWFHTECLRMKRIPKGKLYCPDCRKLPQFKIMKKGPKTKIHAADCED